MQKLNDTVEVLQFSTRGTGALATKPYEFYLAMILVSPVEADMYCVLCLQF